MPHKEWRVFGSTNSKKTWIVLAVFLIYKMNERNPQRGVNETIALLFGSIGQHHTTLPSELRLC